MARKLLKMSDPWSFKRYTDEQIRFIVTINADQIINYWSSLSRDLMVIMYLINSFTSFYVFEELNLWWLSSYVCAMEYFEYINSCVVSFQEVVTIIVDHGEKQCLWFFIISIQHNRHWWRFTRWSLLGLYAYQNMLYLQ